MNSMINNMDIQIRPQPFNKNQLDAIKSGLRSGRIRRFGAIVNHQRLNFTHNALIGWQRDSVGRGLAEKLKKKDYMSHIYLRKPHPLWPYGLYTMIHAQSKKELDLYIAELCGIFGGCGYKVLTTIKEFKKTSFIPCRR